MRYFNLQIRQEIHFLSLKSALQISNHRKKRLFIIIKQLYLQNVYYWIIILITELYKSLFFISLLLFPRNSRYTRLLVFIFFLYGGCLKYRLWLSSILKLMINLQCFLIKNIKLTLHMLVKPNKDHLVKLLHI